LDLVAIGLIADLVQLSGDCRYLPGVLNDCNRIRNNRLVNGDGLGWAFIGIVPESGDRPTDISFGLASNQCRQSHSSDASFCVELLTTQGRARKSAGRGYGTGKRPSQVLQKITSGTKLKELTYHDQRHRPRRYPVARGCVVSVGK